MPTCAKAPTGVNAATATADNVSPLMPSPMDPPKNRGNEKEKVEVKAGGNNKLTDGAIHKANATASHDNNVMGINAISSGDSSNSRGNSSKRKRPPPPLRGVCWSGKEYDDAKLKQVQAQAAAMAMRLFAAAGSGISNPSCTSITLELTPGEKLGINLEDSIFGMPQLTRVKPDSPAWGKIPPKFHKDCCIALLRSKGVQQLQPKTINQCVWYFSKVRTTVPSKVEIFLIQTQSLVFNSLNSPSLSGTAQLQPSVLTIPPSQNKRDDYTTKPTSLVDAYKEWEEQYEALVEYKKKHRHCNVSPSENPKLAQWICVQREERANCKLNQRRKELLNKIGLGWAFIPTQSKKSDPDPNSQEKCIQKFLLSRNIPPSSSDASDPNCGEEVKANSTVKSSTLSREERYAQREERVSKIQKELPPKKKKYPKPSWNDQYESLVRFKTRCDFFPTSGHLYDWLEEQKKAVGSLTCERVQKLIELGVQLPRENIQKLCEQVDNASFKEWYAQHIGENAGDDGADEATVEEPKSKKQKKDPVLLAKAGDQTHFWKTAEAAKCFGFTVGDDVLQGLQDRVDLLRKANESADGWTCLVANDGVEEQYSDMDIMDVRQKALILAKAYLLAMEKMNKRKWGDCCEEAVAQLNGLGLRQHSAGLIQKWNVAFRNAKVFPHPGRLVNEKKERKEQGGVLIFEYFPKAKEMCYQYAEENNDQLCPRIMREELVTNILPALETESRVFFDDSSPEQKLLVKLLANPPSRGTVRKWMKFLNIKYTIRKGRGESYLSQRMKEAWASGKYANRRPKGQGLRRGKASLEDGGGDDHETGDEDGGGDDHETGDEDEIADEDSEH